MTLNMFLKVLVLIFAMSVTKSLGQDTELLTDYSQSYRLCVDKDFTDPCSQIDRDQLASCRRAATKADCVLDADAGQPVIAILTAEEALVAAPLVTGRAVVIGEVIKATPPYQTAVLVRSSFTGGFANLTGLRYCHPGYRHDELVTRYILEELDWKAISLNCTNGTIEEQKFAALAGFFGSSCRPGQWVEDYEMDTRLKLQYPSLCSLCGGSGCDASYQTPFTDTLSCLTNSGGDLALTTLDDAQTFFNASASNAQNYKYLCADGNVSDATNPCVWTKQMPRLIISSSDSGVIMQGYLRTKMPWYETNNFSMPNSPGDFENYLATVLEISRNEKVELKMLEGLSTYVAKYRTIPSNTTSQQCNMSVRWSTLNNRETAKCQWLSQAAINVGLQPVISCVQNQNGDVLSSLDDVGNGVADIVYADANYGYIARRKNLSNIAYTETDHRQLSKILLVVRNSTNNTFTTFSDLRGKGVCIPEYGGKEWLAWIDFLRRSNIIADSCDYGTLFSDFVGQSCAPGAISSAYDIPGTNSDKLCATCVPVNNTMPAKYCNADSDNKYFGSEGALRCLTDGNADYAIISTSEIRSLRLRADQQMSDLQVVNRNGTLTTFPGLKVDEESPLTIITAGEVLIGSNSSIYNDTMLLLRNIERHLGLNLDKPFKVFFEFNRTRDLLFPDSTPGLFFGPARTERYIENYRQLIANSENCQTLSSAATYRLALAPILFAIFCIQVFRQYF